MWNPIWILFRVRRPLWKLIFIKRNHVIICFLFCFFYSNSNLLSRMFSEQLYFWRGYFFTIFQSDYFDTAVTFLEHIFFQSSCCFLLFQNSHFSQHLFSQNSFFFRTKILQSSHFLRMRSSLWQLLFGTAVFPCLG